MPDGGDVKISYNPDAKDGFRLGLMQDFGLDISDAEDAELDDILYIDYDKNGGIIAGDNPRSVLLSIYEYSRKHSNIDFLHVWLADGSNNHCEREECQKKNAIRLVYDSFE